MGTSTDNVLNFKYGKFTHDFLGPGSRMICQTKYDSPLTRLSRPQQLYLKVFKLKAVTLGV